MATWNLCFDVTSPSQPQFPRPSTAAATHTEAHGTRGVDHFKQSSAWIPAWWTCTAAASQRFVCQAPFTRYNLLSNRFDNRLNKQWLFVQHGCQTGCIYRVDSPLYRVNGYQWNRLLLCYCGFRKSKLHVAASPMISSVLFIMIVANISTAF